MSQETDDIQAKLEEQSEVILEQQRQLNEAYAEIEQLRATGGTDADDEKDELIREQMAQILELQAKLDERSGGGDGDDEDDHEAVLREQMQQIIELTEQVERLEARVKELGG